MFQRIFLNPKSISQTAEQKKWIKATVNPHAIFLFQFLPFTFISIAIRETKIHLDLNSFWMNNTIYNKTLHIEGWEFLLFRFIRQFLVLFALGFIRYYIFETLSIKKPLRLIVLSDLRILNHLEKKINCETGRAWHKNSKYHQKCENSSKNKPKDLTWHSHTF